MTNHWIWDEIAIFMADPGTVTTSWKTGSFSSIISSRTEVSTSSQVAGEIALHQWPKISQKILVARTMVTPADQTWFAGQFTIYRYITGSSITWHIIWESPKIRWIFFIDGKIIYECGENCHVWSPKTKWPSIWLDDAWGRGIPKGCASSASNSSGRPCLEILRKGNGADLRKCWGFP